MLRPMLRFATALAIAVVGASVFLVFRSRPRAPAQPAVEAPREPEPSPPRTPPRPAAAPISEDPIPRHLAQRQAASGLHEELERILATEVAALKSASEVDGYLDKLEARARAKRQVGYLEVQPGREAILALPLPHEEAQRQVQVFSDRMAALSAAFRPPTSPTGEKP